MCDCRGLLDDDQTKCSGCEDWREHYRMQDGSVCGVVTGKIAKRAGSKLCSNCWTARAPPQPQTRPPSSPRSSVSGRSTPVQTPMMQTPPAPQAATEARMDFVMGRMEEMLARMESIMGLMLSQQQSSVFGAAGPPLPPPGIATACAPPAPPSASNVAASASAASGPPLPPPWIATACASPTPPGASNVAAQGRQWQHRQEQ